MADLRNYQSRAQTGEMIDQGLRSYMLKVYNLMALGLAITGLAAFLSFQFAFANGELTAFGQAIYVSPLKWVVIFAPVALVFFLSFRIEKMSLFAAQLTFWIYAALVGASLSSIFIVYTDASIVKTFAEEGARVAIGASSHTREAEALAKSLPANGGHLVVQADLTDRRQIAKAAEDVVSGLAGLDIFVHSAGVDVTQTAVTHETSEALWDKMMDLHLNAAFFLSRALIPTMLKGNKPAMVFIGSVCGLVAWEGDVAYNVAKAGLQHLARCIASDYAKQGLRANVIAPGVIDTPLTRNYASGMPGGEAEGLKTLAALHPLGRIAVPAEIAGAAAFLASDKASFITGTVLPIDGGLVNV